MKKKIFYLLLGVSLCTIQTSFAANKHTTKEDTYEPLVSNYSIVTIGLMQLDLLHQNKELPTEQLRAGFSGWLGRNVALLYAFPIRSSRFSICPGIGWESLRYNLSPIKRGNKMYYSTLKKGKNHTKYEEIRSEDLGGESWDIASEDVKHAVFQLAYLDLLCRVRFNSVLDAPKEGFHGWLGAKLGFRTRSSTTVAYHAANDAGSLIHMSDFHLSRCTLGLQIGAGYSRFGIEGGYVYTPLFREDKFYNKAAVVPAIYPFSIALYVDLF